MVKEYIMEKLNNISIKLGNQQKELENILEEEDILREKLRKMRGDNDFDFEVFSPRSGNPSLKVKVLELNERLNQAMTNKGRLKEQIKELKEKKIKFQNMKNEIVELEKLAGKKL